MTDDVSAKFKVGTLVKHRSGGPVMVVAEVRESTVLDDGKPVVDVVCEWFAGDGPTRAVFDTRLLFFHDNSPMVMGYDGVVRRQQDPRAAALWMA